MSEQITEQGVQDFNDFYRGAYPSLVRALTLSLSSNDLAHSAADESMARAYSRWNEVRTYRNPQGWCYRVGLNYGRSIIRRIQRKPRPVMVNWSEDHLPHPELWASIKSLDPPVRDVLVCRAIYELSVAETAEILGVPQGTVKSRYSRARAVLRQQLSDEPPHPTPTQGVSRV